MKIHDFRLNYYIKHCAVILLTAWCFICLMEMPFNISCGINPVSDISSVSNISIAGHCAMVLSLFLILSVLMIVLGKRAENIQNVLLFISVFLYAVISSGIYNNVYYGLFAASVTSVILMYCFNNLVKEQDVAGGLKDLKNWQYVALLSVLMIFTAGFIGTYTVIRYLTYSSPNFDFGIFSQMFYYMKHTFTMKTTCERDMLMSHMKVHISPAWFLILPFYAIFESPVTIQVMQAVILAIPVILLAKICSKHNFSKKVTILICAAYLFFPVISSGCGYDAHENMFLPLALFMLIFAFETDKTWLLVLSVIFTLGIKEDAAVYVIFISLYMILADKKYKKGIVTFIAAALYFILAVTWLNKYGDGTLTFRYNNVIPAGDGNVFGMIRTFITNPAYMITQIMSKDNIEFIISVTGALAFVPFAVKKWQTLILFGPFILFNLLPDYAYAHNIGFQYVFGSGCMLIYAAICNMNECEDVVKIKKASVMAIFSVIFFASLSWSKINVADKIDSSEKRETYNIINEALDMIPDDASVAASTFLVPHLSERKYLYEVYYTDKETGYVAIDLRGIGSSTIYADGIDVSQLDSKSRKYIMSDEYENLYYKESCIIILKHK